MREPSTSITQLVKSVAKEVFREEIEKLSSFPVHVINEAESCRTIKTELERSGWSWSKEEDDCLMKEVKVALETIARSHSRSVEAIRCRIHMKTLLGSKP